MYINSVPTFFCNLYAPDGDDLEFFKTLTMHIDIQVLENIIMGGDFDFLSLIHWIV